MQAAINNVLNTIDNNREELEAMIEAQIDRKVEPLVWERDAEIKSWLFSTDGEWMISRHGHMGFWLSRRDHDYNGDQIARRFKVVATYDKLAEAKASAEVVR